MLYSVDVVWQASSPALQAEAIRFWSEEAALSYDEATARAHQLLTVARDRTGAIAATSTAYATPVGHLGFPCYYYRSYVGRAHRAIGLRSLKLGKCLLSRSFETLNQRFVDGRDRDTLGLYLEIQNQKLRRHHRQTVWQLGSARFAYIGITESGRLCRLAYFDNSSIPRM